MAREDELLKRVWENAPAYEGSATATTNRTPQLAKGVYTITSDIDIFFIQGGSAIDADDTPGSTSIPLWAKTYGDIKVADPDTNGYVAFIRDGATDGTVWITKAN